MNYCYHYNRYRGQEKICLGVSALFGLMFCGWAVSLFRASTVTAGAVSALVMLVSLGLVWITVMAYLEMCRKYSVSEAGLTVIYPFGIKVTYAWNALSEIGLCKVHYTGADPVEYLAAIRCVVGEERNGPAKGYGWWADSLYGVFRFRKIITVTYTAERLDEFRQMCPFEITDYRYIRHYKEKL